MRIGAPVQTVQGTLLLMRSLRFAEFGPPSVLQIEEVPIPEPGEAEALVHVKAAAINPSDIADVSGRFRNTTLPRTPGRDFAGVVVKGKQHEGEEVWGSAPKLGIVRDGSHAEYVVVPAETLSPKPKSLSMAQAAAIGVPYITAWACVVNAAQIQAGETILVVGAAGAVGQAGTQIANWKQARVIGADITSDSIAGRKNLALLVQSNNAVKPLLVFAAAPYGAIGALIALAIMGTPFGFMAFLGVVPVFIFHLCAGSQVDQMGNERGRGAGG